MKFDINSHCNKYIGTIIALLFFYSPVLAFSQIVGQEVYSELQQEDSARVIVVLRSDVDKFSTLNAKIDSFKTIKARVLSKLQSSHFDLVHNWDTINAFSGYVSQGGIEILSNDKCR